MIWAIWRVTLQVNPLNARGLWRLMNLVELRASRSMRAPILSALCGREEDDAPRERTPIRSQGCYSLTSADLDLPEFIIAMARQASLSTWKGQVVFCGDTPSLI